MNILVITKHLINKFKVAFEGLFFGLLHDSSIQIQFFLGFIIVLLMILLPLSIVEIAIILLLIGNILAFEYINTSIEWICDALIPQESVDVKRIKDLASAAVLWMSLIAAIIAFLILYPPIKEILL